MGLLAVWAVLWAVVGASWAPHGVLQRRPVGGNPFAGAEAEQLALARRQAREALVQANRRRLREKEAAEKEAAEKEAEKEKEERAERNESGGDDGDGFQRRSPPPVAPEERALAARDLSRMQRLQTQKNQCTSAACRQRIEMRQKRLLDSELQRHAGAGQHCGDTLTTQTLPKLEAQMGQLSHRMSPWVSVTKKLSESLKMVFRMLKVFIHLDKTVGAIEKVLSPLQTLPKIGPVLKNIRTKAVVPLGRVLKPVGRSSRTMRDGLEPLIKPFQAFARKLELSKQILDRSVLTSQTYRREVKALNEAGKCSALQRSLPRARAAADKVLRGLMQVSQFQLPAKVGSLKKLFRVVGKLKKMFNKVMKLVNQLKKLMRKKVPMLIPSKKRVSGKKVPYLKKKRLRISQVFKMIEKLGEVMKMVEKTVIKPVMELIKPLEKAVMQPFAKVKKKLMRIFKPVHKFARGITTLGKQIGPMTRVLDNVGLKEFERSMELR